MPDKKFPPRKIHPAPPPRAAFTADQKQPRESKGAPDGAPGMPPGHYSNRSDLPADYYHGMSRERDLAAGDDPRDERAGRKLAESWPRKLTRHLTLDTFVRSDEYAYRQNGGYCLLNCGIFIYFRRLGLTPSLAINAMRNAWIEKQLPVWQGTYQHLFFVEPGSVATVASKVLSLVMYQTDHAQRSGKLPWRVVARPISKNDIWTANLIGTYPSIKESSDSRKLSIFNEDNFVNSTPHPPPLAGTTTLQQALFSSYQPPRNTQVPLRHGYFGMDYAQRRTHPLVLLELQYYENGILEFHTVLVDFTDHLHPGIFDPNFGWLEPRHGYCYFDFELTLQTLWEHYTRHNLSNPLLGLRHHDPIPENFRVDAYQLYEQSTGS